jgi:hypothetical protein
MCEMSLQQTLYARKWSAAACFSVHYAHDSIISQTNAEVDAYVHGVGPSAVLECGECVCVCVLHADCEHDRHALADATSAITTCAC